MENTTIYVAIVTKTECNCVKFDKWHENVEHYYTCDDIFSTSADECL